MRFGIFDHVERATDRSLATQFDERLEFVAAADQAGFYCYHVAEHHSSPLNMVPAPSVYLGAVARATRRIRLGPLVYLLPLYSPLKLAEEICMLDHMSKGRLEVGIGRGVSPYELRYHHVDHDESRDIFFDAYACLKEALTHDKFSYKGPYYEYTDVPMALRPLQQPHPSFWYGSSNTTGSTWAGEQGLNFTSNGPTARAKENIETFRAGLAKRGGPAQPRAEFPGGGPAVAVVRHIVVADTDAEAVRIAKPALEHHARSLNWIRRENKSDDLAKRLNLDRAEDFESWQRQEMAVAGSPDTVLAELERQANLLGLNYLICYLFFGNMALPDALRSLQLFSGEVMPKLSAELKN